MIARAFASESHDPYRNLAVEEALLEGGFDGGSAFLLYIDDPCLVVGRNQNPWAEISPRARSSEGPPVLRRVSGGGTVYHDRGNLNWAFIVPRSRHDSEAELSLVADFLGSLGIAVVSGPRGGLFVAGDSPHCGKKLSGTARRLSAERVLHHGTLLVDADLDRLRSCLGGIATDSSRALPSIASPSVNLSQLLPGIGIEELTRGLVRRIVGREAEEPGLFADPRRVEESIRRLRSWEWTWGATPAFSLGFGWREGHINLDIKGGRIAAISGLGSERLNEFIGEKFDYEVPEDCLSLLR